MMMQEAIQISEFYKTFRGYWQNLSAASDGKKSYTLNFGYWVHETDDLYCAQHNLLNKVRAFLGEPGCLTTGLEIGCGIGGISIGLLQSMPGAQMTAIDIAPEQLEIAKLNAAEQGVAESLQLLNCSAMQMPFDEAVFDFVVCIESSFHYTDKTAFMQGVYRVLKPGGRFVLADITCENNAEVVFRRGNYFEKKEYYVAQAKACNFLAEQVEDIGSRVYAPLLRHIKAYNTSHKEKSGKYWSVVLSNYAKLAKCGMMGYHIYAFQKPCQP